MTLSSLSTRPLPTAQKSLTGWVTKNALAALGALAIAGGALSLTPTPASAQQGPPPVSVANPLSYDVLDWVEYTGRFEAVETVEVRARVGGYVESVHFTDGEVVEAGSLLFIVDPRPFEIALTRAEANLRTAQARADFAATERERARTLRARNTVSQQELDTRIQEDLIASAGLASAEADVREAQLNLDFTRITAPISGRISRTLVDVGNLISGGTAEATLLTSIVSQDPIHLYFTAEDSTYLTFRRDRGANPDPATVPVLVKLADEDRFGHQGKMDFIDNRIDRGTGTISGRAVLDNKDGLFLPGLFARIRLLAQDTESVMLLPEGAIGADQSRRFVYVLDGENIAQIRPVRLGRLIEGFRVIEDGLAPEDRVVVNGLLRVRPGSPVTPQDSPITLPDGFGQGNG
ncbi:MAG: efflux RND transporter periplasmic adaptor subunit [Rhodospirillaceae bacterium]